MLIGDRGSIRAGAGLPFPQQFAGLRVVSLELAARLAVEDEPAGGRKRAAALPDRIGHLLLPDDLVGTGIDAP